MVTSLKPYASAQRGVPLGGGYGTAAMGTENTSQNRFKLMSKRKRFMCLAIPAIMGVMSLNREWISVTARRLTLQCIHNVYAHNEQMALDMPPPPDKTLDVVPAYIALCQEWIRMEADETYEGGTVLEEDENVCMDWTAPHYTTMELFAAQLVDRMQDKGRYKHNCFKTRTWDEAVLGFDRTTVQQTLPIAAVSPAQWNQQDIVTPDMMMEQCKICLAGYDQTAEDTIVRNYITHHCFVFPEQFGPFNGTAVDGMTFSEQLAELQMEETPESPARRRLSGEEEFQDQSFHDIENEEERMHLQRHLASTNATRLYVPGEARPPNVVPFTTVVNQVRARLRYLGMTWSNTTHNPPNEWNTGAVIYVDVSSTPIAGEIYDAYIYSQATSITILAGPLCATTNLMTGQLCTDYVQDLVDYFRAARPNILSDAGSNGGHGVDSRIVTSTAALWSRMIMADRLLCPPYSPNCLLPMLCKRKGTRGYFLDQSDWLKAWHFFTYMGSWGQTQVWLLADAHIPEANSYAGRRLGGVDLTARTTSTGQPIAPIFQQVREVTDKKSGCTTYYPPPLMTVQESKQKSKNDILNMAAAKNIKSAKDNPKAKKTDYSWTENVPKQGDIQKAFQDPENILPINVNYNVDNPEKRATDELGLDVDLGFQPMEVVQDRFEDMVVQHSASEYRIVQETNAAKDRQFAAVSNGNFPPSMEMEVYCPEYLDDGRLAVYDRGMVKTESLDGSSVVISDGVGTVEFDKANLVESTIPIQHDAEGNPYNTINDPVTGKDVTITGKDLQQNQPNGVTLQDPIGIIMIDNVTHDGTMITEGGTGTIQETGTQSKFEGTVLKTGGKQVDIGTPIRFGRGYAINTRMDPGTKRTIYGPFGGFTSSSSESSSDSGGSGYKGYHEEESDPKAPSSSDEGGLTSDSRDMGYRGVKETSVNRGMRAKKREHRTLEQRLAALKAPRTDGLLNSASSSSEISSDETARKAGQLMIKVPAHEFKLGMDDRELKRICFKYKDRVAQAKGRTKVFGQNPFQEQPEGIVNADIPQRRHLLEEQS
mmetsp:Transcript_28237/g.43304  ORF Transcript_28237/g.43304 Transcript_28237/m.43304 type:complete len:1047 (-) Transcript_28237:144-3284(-)|eukprot:CAMPEP_0195284294 /NCGR_PEP_ID=MMETSP0707-20130614/2533_1 /TAXON_ID=33640 /ORGANISM="Asterionellopsis glacialis, Strain CCMP134" /LENGTH=1046 /DNA_ID=CAMNT_0040343619 /DNA_START=167 /DNA_END=3307 /DNA_ORIENTATION=+